MERCFDDSEGSQLIIHAPFGGRVNRALGLALRKRFCVSFDFELQAAADDDTVVLSLGPQHSFPLTRVQSMLSSAAASQVLTQAVLPHPMLGARWRWNLTRALVLPRMNGGKRRPIHLQRMEADDLLAAVWPGLAACQENAPPGPVSVPDHVLARQTVDDCLHEGLSVEGLVDLWAKVESGEIAVHAVESSEPSPFSHAILSGRPFTYLDDAPLEERRTRALSLRRGLGELGPDGLPVPAKEMAALDPEAVAAVLEQVCPRAARPRRAARPPPLPRGGPPLRRMGTVVRRPGGGRPGRTARRELGGDRTARDGGDAGRRRRGGRGLRRRPPTAGGPGQRRPARRRGSAPVGGTTGRTARRGPGSYRAGAPGGEGLGHRAARRPLVRAQPAGATAPRQQEPAPRPGRSGVHRRFRPLPHALAARHAREPAGGAGRPARGARATAGDRGAGRGVGGPDPAGPRRRVTTRAGWTSCASPARSCGDASPRGPTGRDAAAPRRRPRHWPSCCATSSSPCCARCGPAPPRPSPGSVHRPTSSPRCGPAAPASVPNWRR